MEKFEPKTKVEYSNCRIVIDLDPLQSFGREKPIIDVTERAHHADSIIASILRHVDLNLRSEKPVFMYDTKELCIYCGYDPEPDIVTGEPACCQKAGDDFMEWQAVERESK
jgi:hypothetical protein